MAASKVATVERNGHTTAKEPSVKDNAKEVQITPPKKERVAFRIIGTSPLVQCRFGAKAKNQMLEAQMAGSVGKKGKKREPKDFDACFNDARHISVDGWDGIHAGGFRAGLVDACKLVGFFMTRAKLGIRIIADGYSADGTPLVRITKGTPTMHIGAVRNASGVADLRARPMWAPGWEAVLTIEYDADMFTTTDVLNLLARLGSQCGICEGRANSKDSTGCDWGYFEVATVE